MPLKRGIEGDGIDLARAGHVFHASQYLSVASGASAYVEMRTGTAEVVLLGWTVITGTEAFRVRGIEAPTIGTPGTTALASHNVNRILSATTATMLLFTDPASISAGTTLYDTITPSGANKVGGVAAEAHPWTLKKDTSYVFRVENLGNSTSIAAVELSWLEANR
jgi:hypothetical protein